MSGSRSWVNGSSFDELNGSDELEGSDDSSFDGALSISDDEFDNALSVSEELPSGWDNAFFGWDNALADSWFDILVEDVPSEGKLLLICPACSGESRSGLLNCWSEGTSLPALFGDSAGLSESLKLSELLESAESFESVESSADAIVGMLGSVKMWQAAKMMRAARMRLIAMIM